MKPPLKDRLRRGEVCTGTFLLFFFGGDVVQFFAGLGLDFLILDMEHSALDFTRARDTIVAARACGIAPLVRVAEVQYTQVARALDAGAEGIVLPRVKSAAQCRELVRCGRFPPEGERGLTTFAGHNDFTGVADVGRFVAERNRNILLFVQIETRAGLESRDAILSVPGIDGCLVGTGDLAFSLGVPGQTNHPDVVAATDQVFAACRERHLIATLPIRTPADTARWQATGMNMVTLSTDGGLLAAGTRQFLASVDRSANQLSAAPSDSPRGPSS